VAKVASDCMLTALVKLNSLKEVHLPSEPIAAVTIPYSAPVRKTVVGFRCHPPLSSSLSYIAMSGAMNSSSPERNQEQIDTSTLKLGRGLKRKARKRESELTEAIYAPVTEVVRAITRPPARSPRARGAGDTADSTPYMIPSPAPADIPKQRSDKRLGLPFDETDSDPPSPQSPSNKRRTTSKGEQRLYEQQERHPPLMSAAAPGKAMATPVVEVFWLDASGNLNVSGVVTQAKRSNSAGMTKKDRESVDKRQANKTKKAANYETGKETRSSSSTRQSGRGTHTPSLPIAGPQVLRSSGVRANPNAVATPPDSIVVECDDENGSLPRSNRANDLLAAFVGKPKTRLIDDKGESRQQKPPKSSYGEREAKRMKLL
jgi:hypothetical protein